MSKTVHDTFVVDTGHGILLDAEVNSETSVPDRFFAEVFDVDGSVLYRSTEHTVDGAKKRLFADHPVMPHPKPTLSPAADWPFPVRKS